MKRFVKYNFIILILAIWILPGFVLAAILPIGTSLLPTEGVYDLSVGNGDITFSENLLISGDTIRIYATVRNVGSQDMRGYITFFQGNAVIDNSQTLSIRPGNSSDAWVDFVVPASEFNILARIQGTKPADQN